MESWPEINVVKSNGMPLDLQLQVSGKEDGQPLLNQESELHGNRQRNNDFKKLTDHAPLAEVNSFVYRDKSMRNIEKNLSEFVDRTSGVDADVVVTSVYCRNNQMFNTSRVTTVIARDGVKIWDSRDE